MSNIDYHFSTNIQTRFSDFDRFLHVNNSVYFTYFDCAKNEYFHKVLPCLDRSRYGAAVVNMKTDFLSEICEDERISVQTSVEKIGNRSFTLSQIIVNDATKEVKCVCTSILVFFDLMIRKAIEVQTDWIDLMEKFENRKLKEM